MLCIQNHYQPEEVPEECAIDQWIKESEIGVCGNIDHTATQKIIHTDIMLQNAYNCNKNYESIRYNSPPTKSTSQCISLLVFNTTLKTVKVLHEYCCSKNPKENINLHPSHCVQSREPTSLHALKIPNTGSHTIVWTPENAAHTDRNG